jgi:hypothetical protein
MCGRFNLPGLFQGSVAQWPIGQQLRLVTQILRFLPSGAVSTVCLA